MDIPSQYWRLFVNCLRSGDFGGVQLGMTYEEVRAILGEPDAMGGTSRKYRTPGVWKYGEIELFFSNNSQTLNAFYWEGEHGCSIYVDENGCRAENWDDWDREIADDVAAGRLDHLMEQAKRQYEEGNCREL